MLGYVRFEVKEKGMFRKCGYSVKKISEDGKKLNIFLSKKFDKLYSKDIKKVIKIFKKEKIDNVLFEKNVYSEYMNIVDSVYVNDINIITGNTLYINMASDIIEYIFDLCENVNLEEIHLGIAIDLLSYNKLEFIKYIADKVRSLTILTTATSKFENLRKEILSEYGLAIKCSDNFKSGLKECDVCLNFDFDNSKILGSVQNRCIYINFNKSIDKIRKSFKGIVINDINVDISNFDIEDVELNNYRSLAIAQAIDENNINRKIVSLIGINEEISSDEFVKFKIYKGKNK